MAINGSAQGRGGRRRRRRNESAATRALNSVFSFLRLAEFEVLFVLLFVVAFVMFKRLTSLPEYNQILVKKPGDGDRWPY